ncbi:AAA family ATPase [Epibacterium sp. DP7N7-1]|nr:AAA family ATPase [Epibacterium sp. DP7N7-1]
MYYHETMSAIVKATMACGEIVDAETAIVRDASGRLSIVRKSFNDAAALKSKVREDLGPYATDLAVVEAGLAEAILRKPQSSRRTIYIEGCEEPVTYTYVDNRVVGEDWLGTGPVQRENVGAKRFTFYSLKGGVGRSTALAIYAAHLAASGKKSLVIDLDIEAPGLGSILLPNGKENAGGVPRFGVIDYLLENGIAGIDPQSLSEFVATSPLGSGAIDVLPAVGSETENRPDLFVEKLSRALTEDYISGEKYSLTRQVREMIEVFDQAGSYDAILIDARAGFSEISAATLMGLDSHLVLFGVDQSQTFSGYRYLLSHFIAQTDFSSEVPSWRERLTFVQSKAPGTKKERSSFRAELFEVCADTIYDQFSDDDENETELFTFAPADMSPFAPHNSTHIRFDSAFGGFDPLKHEEQLDPELFSGAYAKFINRLDEISGQEAEA